MSYFITFETSRKPEVFDDVKRIMLFNNIIVLMFNDGSEKSLTNVMGITDYHYNEG